MLLGDRQGVGPEIGGHGVNTCEEARLALQGISEQLLLLPLDAQALIIGREPDVGDQQQVDIVNFDSLEKAEQPLQSINHIGDEGVVAIKILESGDDLGDDLLRALVLDQKATRSLRDHDLEDELRGAVILGGGAHWRSLISFGCCANASTTRWRVAGF